MTRRGELDRFLAWLTGQTSQTENDTTATGRSLRRSSSWCWDLRARLPATGEVFDVLEIDGFNLRTGWCVLVATHRGKTVAYQWCSHESGASWGALFQRVPEPVVVVCDGGRGMHAALKEHWPGTRVQRCLVHLQRNVRTYVTTRSKTPAAQALWGLAVKLTQVHTRADAETWTRLLLAWENQFLYLTKERTYRSRTNEIPSWVKPGQQWWYTHQRLRSGYQVLAGVIKADHLFTFLDPRLEAINVPSTTNKIEGGTNAQLRLLLRHHRGMGEEHQRRGIEWWLYLHSHHPDPTKILTEHNQHRLKARTTPPPEASPGPVLYDTGISAEEGLWVRHGWAGRG